MTSDEKLRIIKMWSSDFEVVNQIHGSKKYWRIRINSWSTFDTPWYEKDVELIDEAYRLVNRYVRGMVLDICNGH